MNVRAQLLGRGAVHHYRLVARQDRSRQPQSRGGLCREDAHLRAGIDEGVDPVAVELHREKQMAAERPSGAEPGVGLAPGRRRVRAGLLCIYGHAMARQVEIDIKAAQRVSAEHTVERSEKNAPGIDRSDANPPPWDGYRA